MRQKTKNEYVLIEYTEHKVDVDTTTSYLSYDLIEKTNLIQKIFQDSDWLQYKELVKILIQNIQRMRVSIESSLLKDIVEEIEGMFLTIPLHYLK